MCYQQVLLDHYTFQNHFKLIHKIKPLEYYKKYVAGIDANDERERASDLINWILERTEGEVNVDLDKLFPRLNKKFQYDEALDKSVEDYDETAMIQPDEGGDYHLSPAHNMTLAEHEHITDLDEGFGEDDGAGWGGRAAQRQFQDAGARQHKWAFAQAGQLDMQLFTV